MALSSRLGSLTAGARRRRASIGEHALLALVAFVPQLLSQPGVVASDTKSYLYIDPSKFLRQSASMWDPSVGLGTVTHQQIGYLFPMAPFFALVQKLHIPMWVGQRLWVGAILFFAGSGILYLCRTIDLEGPGRLVAAFAYMLSPYVLQYLGRISVILLPWAGLGWMLGLVVRATRTGGWRHPAAFALVWLTVSGVNASGVIYVVVAPLLWLAYSIFVSKEHTLAQAWSTAWRTGILTVAVSLWWAEGLLIEGHYGVNILSYTESVQSVGATSLSSEVARGLGYWYYYGADVLGQWAPTSVGLTQQPLLVVASFAFPVFAIAAALVMRWRRRAFFVLLCLVGLVLAVGTHPYLSPSPVGGVLKDLMTGTSFGMALRSTDRATPVVILGLAMLLGAGVTALARRVRPAGLAVAVLVMAVAAAANPPLWNGTTVDDHYTQPSPLPRYVTNAAKALNSKHTDTRVLAVPGQNFAAYRWGDTVDPVWSGLLSRPFATREQQPLGSVAGYDLLAAFDNQFQEGTVDTKSVAPLASLMGAGDLLVQNDLEYERYNQPQPKSLWQALAGTPGLGSAVGFGTPRANVATLAGVHQASTAPSPNAPPPSPVEVLPVSKPRSTVRAESATESLVVDGDGDGLAGAASAGLVNETSPVLYAGTLDTHPKLLSSAMSGSSTLVVTDTNRKQSFYWNAIQQQPGPTLTASSAPPLNPLVLFPAAPKSAQSTAQSVGVAAVKASSSTAQHQAFMAMDGDPNSAWEVGAPIGQYWQVSMVRPVTANHVTIRQPVSSAYSHAQWITEVSLRFDGKQFLDVKLGPSSRSEDGQRIYFPTRTFKTLRIVIRATNLARNSRKPLSGVSPVGLSEVGIAGAQIVQSVVMPSDLLTKAGTASSKHRLVILMTRQRVAASDPTQSDPEPTLSRSFTLPTRRSFTLTGTATLSSLAGDSVVDASVQRPDPEDGIVSATSSSRLAGQPEDAASAALDGNDSTMWSPAEGAINQAGSSINVELSRAVTFDHLDLRVVADGYHSVPRTLRIATESGSVNVALPKIEDRHSQGSSVSVPVTFPALTGKDITVTVTGVRLEYTRYFYGNQPSAYNADEVAQPLGIAELGIPGVQVGAPPVALPGSCRTDLLSIDGRAVPLEISGTTEGALSGQLLTLGPCASKASGIELGPGRHTVTTSLGSLTGFDVDQLVLDSAPVGGGAPSATTSSGGGRPDSPQVHVASRTSTTIKLRVTGVSGKPFWLVLGESLNRGWQATSQGRNLGPPTLVDGFANGWLIGAGSAAHASGGSLSITLRWAPQKTEDIALALSFAAALVCLVLVLWRRRPRSEAGDARDANFDSGPTVRGTWAEAGREMPTWLLLTAAGIVLVASALIVPTPAIAAEIALVVVAGLLLNRVHKVLVFASLACALSAVAYTVILQAQSHFAPAGWPIHFEVANDLMWAAFVFLASEVFLARVWRFVSNHGQTRRRVPE